jgi:hypothetical protein
MMLLSYLLLLASPLLLSIQVQAQRGGSGSWEGSGRGGWEDEGGEFDGEEVQQAIITQTQIQTRTMVTTAISRAPTTIVQPTTVLRISTVMAPAITQTSVVVQVQSPSSSPSAPLVPSQQASESTPARDDSDLSNHGSSVSGSGSGSESALAPSGGPIDALTVNTLDPSTTPTAQEAGTRAIGAAEEVSAPATLLPATLGGSGAGGGTGMQTTGIPNFGDEANGVVYGHVSLSLGLDVGDETEYGIVADYRLLRTGDAR